MGYCILEYDDGREVYGDEPKHDEHWLADDGPHTGGPCLDENVVESPVRRPRCEFFEDPTHGQLMNAFLDCLFERRPYSLWPREG